VVVPVVTPVELPAPEPARTGRDQVIRLLAEERYAEALAALQQRPRDDLLYAVALVHAGRLDEAAAVCRNLIDADGLDANTHHLLGVCLEGRGDLDAAIAQYRLAAYLDPTFAMPRLRMGLLARRRGEDTVAATELERCASLLRHETDERVLFFGGGFARSALVALCRAELDLCGSAR
jgi:chemotaxis protein methyltransferase CheR